MKHVKEFSLQFAIRQNNSASAALAHLTFSGLVAAFLLLLPPRGRLPSRRSHRTRQRSSPAWSSKIQKKKSSLHTCAVFRHHALHFIVWAVFFLRHFQPNLRSLLQYSTL